MLLECTECELPYYNYEDLEEHYEITHPKIHRLSNRLDVRIVKRILNKHQKTYRCPHCYQPFPHPDLRDSHVTLSECDPEDDSDCEREEGMYGRLRRGSVESIVYKFELVLDRFVVGGIVSRVGFK
ncbi:hypothetical protein DFH08DRAFT_1086800 [Mycena albidolilacea]|uniref:C2H2-type domain-containing protein n=1 Tax=Mycena albidolilacea TaxID=1033008 RepID=A0AAD6ZCF3_9AGAR|nr:hypothetical protein DFH08DRAFT_1086800 [Mycena albidolilacea]